MRFIIHFFSHIAAYNAGLVAAPIRHDLISQKCFSFLLYQNNYATTIYYTICEGNYF